MKKTEIIILIGTVTGLLLWICQRLKKDNIKIEQPKKGILQNKSEPVVINGVLRKMLTIDIDRTLQDKDGTCGYPVLASLTTYLTKPIKKEQIDEYYKVSKQIIKTPPSDFKSLFEQCNPEYSMQVVSPDEKQLKKIINIQLQKGFPVPFLYTIVFKTDAERQGLHYSLVSGITIDEGKTYVLLTDGRPKETRSIISYDELLKRLDFKNFTNFNDIKETAGLLALKLIRDRTVFIIEKRK